MTGKNPFGIGRRKPQAEPAAQGDATDPMMRGQSPPKEPDELKSALLSTTAGRVENLEGGKTVWIAGNLSATTLDAIKSQIADVETAMLSIEEYTEIDGNFAVVMPQLLPLGEFLSGHALRPGEAFQVAVDLASGIAALQNAGLAPASLSPDRLFCEHVMLGIKKNLQSFRVKFAAFHELVPFGEIQETAVLREALETGRFLLDAKFSAPWHEAAAVHLRETLEKLIECKNGLTAGIALQYLLESLRAPAAVLSTDTGLVRTGNEDCGVLSLTQAIKPLASSVVAFVADGMGGHAAGEIASRIAASAVEGTLADWRKTAAHGDAQLFGHIERTFRRANEEIVHETALNPSRSGMGTTLTGLLLLSPSPAPAATAKAATGFEAARVWIANLGDSRTCIACADGLVRVSRDHSEVQRMVDAGEIDEDEAFSHPLKNIISKCLGGGSAIFADSPDVCAMHAGPGDLFIIASDGLTDMLRDAEIYGILASSFATGASLEIAAANLIEAANGAGGKDNITVALVYFP